MLRYQRLPLQHIQPTRIHPRPEYLTIVSKLLHSNLLLPLRHRHQLHLRQPLLYSQLLPILLIPTAIHLDFFEFFSWLFEVFVVGGEDLPTFVPFGGDVEVLLGVGVEVLVGLLVFELVVFLAPFEEGELHGGGVFVL